jgi:hypothetical protein
LIARVYQRALGRAPTAPEAALARELVEERRPTSSTVRGDSSGGRGESPLVRLEGVEDLLWTLAMLPEFQLIY